MKGEAALAQLVEHIIRNDGVACSSHASGTKITRFWSVVSTPGTASAPRPAVPASR